MPPTSPQLPPLPATPPVAGAVAIARRLQEAGHRALLVGGCVRNWLLREPLHDVDLATSAHPDAIARLFPETRAVGAHFGVMLVFHEGRPYEVATFRSEGNYVDRRRPDQVRFGTLEEDWPRRDFTVNAMYYDPITGELIDPAGGRADVDARLLRTVGDPDRRFDEDSLRLMRAVRFAVRYGLKIEEATAQAIRRHAAGLRHISTERIADELLRILTGPHPGRAMHLMHELGLWPHVIPEIEAMVGCEQPPEFHPEGDVFIHTAMVLDRVAERFPGGTPPALALAALLHDVGKPPTFERTTEDPNTIRFPNHQGVGAEMTQTIGRRLRLPSRLIDQTATLVAGHMRFVDVQRMKRSTLRRFLGQPAFDLHLELHRADCLACHGKLDSYEYCLRMLEELAAGDREAALLPPPLVSGRDLIALGMTPGPALGALLREIRDRQLEGELATPDAALKFARGKIAVEPQMNTDEHG